LRCERGAPRMGMLADEREVPEDVDDAILVRGQDPPDAGHRVHAVRAFVVAVLDKLDRGVGRPQAMVQLTHAPRQTQWPVVQTNSPGKIVGPNHGLLLHQPCLLPYAIAPETAGIPR